MTSRWKIYPKNCLLKSYLMWINNMPSQVYAA